MESTGSSSVAASTHPQLCTSVWANLPQCLVMQILFRVPFSSLIRFRAVCQDWNQLLRSEHILKEHELVGPSKEPWILSYFSKSERGDSETDLTETYDFSCKSWHRIHIMDCEKFWPAFSDGGLLCSDTFGCLLCNSVLNPLTGSMRHLECPSPFSELDRYLCALNVDRTANAYKVIFFASDASSIWKGYDSLLIYDSKEDSWKRAHYRPGHFEVEGKGVVFNRSVYFIMRPESIFPRTMRVELQMVCYNFPREEWGSCIIPSHLTNCHYSRNLHQWQNCIYVISFSLQRFFLSIDKINIAGAKCQNLEVMYKAKFTDLLMNKSAETIPKLELLNGMWMFGLSEVDAYDNLIMLAVTFDNQSGSPQFSGRDRHRILLYDLCREDWSLVEEPPGNNGNRQIYKLAGFEPRRSVVA